MATKNYTFKINSVCGDEWVEFDFGNNIILKSGDFDYRAECLEFVKQVENEFGIKINEVKE